jgi:hypothetical protein
MYKYGEWLSKRNILVVDGMGFCKEIDNLLQLYREADLLEEKDRISRALGAIRDEEILKKVLQFAMSVSYLYFYRVHDHFITGKMIHFLFKVCYSSF